MSQNNTYMNMHLKKWHTIRIFISSTFKDMDHERDILRVVVEPRLNDFFKQMHINVMFVDLRKDVETDKNLSVEQRERKIFDICMDEISDCSPYFIGLVGDRYGWIPPKQILEFHPDLLQLETLLPGAPKEKSVTFYEFMKGVFPKGKISQTALVYIRKNDRNENDNLYDFRMLLKQTLSKSQLKYYSSLTLIDDPTDKDELPVKDIYTDIKQMIMSNLHLSEDNMLDVAQIIDIDQEKFVNEKTVCFWGRTKELKKIEKLLEQSNDVYIVKHSPGVGASAVLCKAYLAYKQKGHCCLFYSEQASGNSMRVEEMYYKWCWQLENEMGCLNFGHLHDIADNQEELERLFCELIDGMIQKKRQVIIFLDVESADSVMSLNKIQKHLHLPMVEVVDKGDMSDEFYNIISKSDCVVDIKEIELSVREKIVEGQREVVRKMLMKRKESCNPRWLTTACFILGRLTKQDYISIRSIGEIEDVEKTIDTYLESFIYQIPNDVEDVVLFWVEKLRDLYGGSYVENLISLLAWSREGWTDEQIAYFVGEGLEKCILFRQSCGELIFKQNDKGLWQMKANIADKWKKSHTLNVSFFQKVKAYLYGLSTDDETKEMHLFCIARQCKDIDICKEIIIHNNMPLDPYCNYALKEFVYMFQEELGEAQKLVLELVQISENVIEIGEIHVWCTFLRLFGLWDAYVLINEAIAKKMAVLTGTSLTTFDQNWIQKYAVLLNYADHCIDMGQYSEVGDMVEQCQRNLLEQLLKQGNQDSAINSAIQIEFFHWGILYIRCLPILQDRLIFVNRVVDLVKTQTIVLQNEAKMNFSMLLMTVGASTSDTEYVEQGIELILCGLKTTAEYIDTYESDDSRILDEARDNYCMGVSDLMNCAGTSKESLIKYQVFIKSALKYAKTMETWSVNPLAYYEMLVYYIQVCMDTFSNDILQLIDSAINDLEVKLTNENLHQKALKLYLILLSYKENIYLEKDNYKEYYETFDWFEGSKKLFNNTIQTNYADYESALIYHQQIAVMVGLKMGNYVKVIVEGEDCINKIINNQSENLQLLCFLSNVLTRLYGEGCGANDDESRELIDKFLNEKQYDEVRYLILHLNKKDLSDYYNLAYCFLRQGKYDVAIDLFEKLLSDNNVSSSFAFSVKTNLLIAYILGARDSDYKQLYDSFDEDDRHDTDIVEIVEAYEKKQQGFIYDGPKGYLLY